MINGAITDREVRLIDEAGTQLGVMPRVDAQRIADTRSLDLVNISPMAKPCVCKIMNYGKYRFDMIKKDKEAKKGQKNVEIKEVQLSQTIDVGDLNTKAKRTREFLVKGAKVKVCLRMRGREMAHPQLSLDVMARFLEIVQDVAVVDKKATIEGRQVIMMLGPIAKK